MSAIDSVDTLMMPRLTNRRVRGTSKLLRSRLITSRRARAIDLAFLPTLDVGLHEALPFRYGWRARGSVSSGGRPRRRDPRSRTEVTR